MDHSNRNLHQDCTDNKNKKPKKRYVKDWDKNIQPQMNFIKRYY